MSRAVRLAIGLVLLIPAMGITGGLLAAAGAGGATVLWVSLGVGVVWTIVVAVWALRAPPAVGSDDGTWGGLRHSRFR